MSESRQERENKVTIHDVTLSLEVEGKGDEAVFADLFEMCSGKKAEEKARECCFEADRALFNRSNREREV
jgi:hypothetical protein